MFICLSLACITAINVGISFISRILSTIFFYGKPFRPYFVQYQFTKFYGVRRAFVTYFQVIIFGIFDVVTWFSIV